MALSPHVFFLLLLSLTFSAPWTAYGDDSGGGANPIHDTCKQTLNYDLCVSTLQVEPTNQKAGVNGHATAALKAAYKSASTTLARITELEKTSTETFMKERLGDCMENYHSALDQIEDSLSTVNASGVNDINTWVTAAMADAEACEDGFQEQSGLKSPLTNDYNEFTKLCSNALAITNLLST